MQQYPDMAELMRLARSPSGQQLIALLQKQGGNTLQKAMEQAAKGDYTTAKQSLSDLLSTQEARKLIKDLEGKL